MPKTEDIIHKQALDSAWSLMKFYGTYEPHGHRSHADNLRQDLGRLDEQIAESNPRSDFEHKLERNLRGKKRAMLDEETGNPDLAERRERKPGDSEVMWPKPEHYERGALDPSHPNYSRTKGYAFTDKNSEDRVSTRDKVKDPESAPGENSFNTRGLGDSIMDGDIPDWLVNPGQEAEDIHPMFYDRFADKGMQLEMPQESQPRQLTAPRNRQLQHNPRPGIRYDGTY